MPKKKQRARNDTNNNAPRHQDAAKKEQGSSLTYILYALIILLFILYIFVFKNNLEIAVLAIILIAVTLIVEFQASVREEGARRTILEIAAAIVVAILAVWLIPSLVLGTSSPVDVVASCSMLPNLHRGDLVLVHGIRNMSAFLSQHNIPVVNVSALAYSNMAANIEKEALYPLAYNSTAIEEIIKDPSQYRISFFNIFCLNSGRTAGSCIADQQYQNSNLVKYNYTVRSVHIGNVSSNIVFTSSITIGNTTVYENYSNPIIVYKAKSPSGISEDIIHRLYAAIRVGNQYYLLTKGDNNPVLDLQSAIYPPNSSEVLGYVAYSVPWLGYPSLIVKGQIGSSDLAGCNQTII